MPVDTVSINVVIYIYKIYCVSCCCITYKMDINVIKKYIKNDERFRVHRM